MAERSRRLLTPDQLSSLSRFSFRMGRPVSGQWTGHHRSPHQGSSVEFSDHKEYVPGDDVRRLDWKAYAKSDRYYIKRYEQETDLSAQIIVDTSNSMDYGSVQLSKFEAASQVALAFSTILLNESDGAGLYAKNGLQRINIPPSSQKTNLRLMEEALLAIEFSGNISLPLLISESPILNTRVSMNIVISDFLCEPNELFASLSPLFAMKRQILLVHIIDPDEVDFPFTTARTRFIDTESDRKVELNPVLIRKQYRQLMNTHIDAIKSGCIESGSYYLQYNTAEKLVKIMANFFARHAT